MIAELMEDIDELDPPRPRVEISKLETKMNHTALALVASGLPIIEMGQDSYTGKFAITVDIYKNSTTTKADILRITRDLPVEITYENYAPSQRPVPHQPDVVNQWLVVLWLKIITIDRTALYMLDWTFCGIFLGLPHLGRSQKHSSSKRRNHLRTHMGQRSVASAVCFTDIPRTRTICTANILVLISEFFSVLHVFLSSSSLVSFISY